MKGDRPGPAPRVRVTSSRREATRHTARPAADEVAEHTDLGEVYVRGLMRAQLRLAASVLLVGAIVLGALPLVFLAMPSARSLLLLGIPLPWLTLGVLIYPAAGLAARYYVRVSERLEAAFVDVVRQG